MVSLNTNSITVPKANPNTFICDNSINNEKVKEENLKELNEVKKGGGGREVEC